MELTTIEQIKKIAEKEGLTRYRISRDANINDTLLRKYFAGVTVPSIANIEKIVEAMGYEIKIVKKEEKRVFKINETGKIVLAKKNKTEEIKKGNDYVIITDSGVLLRTAPFEEVFNEIYEVEKK
ncbi:helix-turn-helix domain-containing protein [Capnocytophaga canis]|uniref:helix-turn-helix domain-containing protein n=1 Tax=Capnocytophaga canis TaxID=1848903 RepID=UPI0037D6DBE4